MSKSKKNIPTYKKGGSKFGEHIGNVGATLLDVTASTVGMPNVADSLYQGNSANVYKGVGDFTGGLTQAAAPMVMNAFIPGSGAIVSAGQNVLGTADRMAVQQPSIDPQTGLPYKQNMATQMGASMGQLGGGITGMVMKPYGGSITQVDGPSHEQGGVVVNSPNGMYEVEKEEVIHSKPGEDRILSDRLKLPGSRKTVAEEFKIYDKLGKIINNSKLPEKVRMDAKAKQEAAFNDLYNRQEQLKVDRVNRYAQRIGLSQPTQFYNGGSFDGDPLPMEDSTKSTTAKPFPLIISPSGVSGKYKDIKIDNNYIKSLGYDYKSGDWKKPETLMLTKDGVDYSYGREGENMVFNPMIKTPKEVTFDVTEKKIAKRENDWVPVTTSMINGQEAGIFRKGNTWGKDRDMRYYFDRTQGKYLPVQAYGGSIKKYTNGGEYGPEELKPDYLPMRNTPMNTTPIGVYKEGEELSLKGNTDITPVQREDLNVPVGKFEGNNIPWGKIATQIGLAAGNNIGNIYDLYRANDVENTSYTRVNPAQMDPTAALNYNNMMGRKLVEDIKNSSVGNSSTYLQSRKDAAINQMMTNARIREQFENQNAQLRQQSEMYNAGIRDKETDANAMNRATSRNIKSNAYANIGQNIMGQTKDYNMGERDIERMRILAQYYNDPTFQKMIGKYTG